MNISLIIMKKLLNGFCRDFMETVVSNLYLLLFVQWHLSLSVDDFNLIYILLFLDCHEYYVYLCYKCDECYYWVFK